VRGRLSSKLWVCAVLVLPSFILPALGQIQEWKPIGPDELKQNTPLVERDADAEALFWEVRLDDAQVEKTVFRHYLRMKIFTARGVEAQSRIDLPYINGVKIADIVARTTKTDGTVVELKKDAVFDRTIVKAGKAKIRAKSFVMPGVEPGAIIEYQWREERDSLGQYVRLEFQRQIPVRSVKYYIKPFSNSVFPYPMTFNVFHMPNTPMEKEKNGFSSFTLTNVPAFKEEPYMPPESEVRPWILVYYAEPNPGTPNQYWSSLGRQIFELDKTDLKVNDDIRRAAKEIVGTATDAEEKLAKIFEYTRTKITNPYDDASGYREADLAKLKENNSPADTLKRGLGTGHDIDMLFGAMAIAAGFEVRIARLPDRSDVFFDPSFANSYFMSTFDIAVKVGNQWRFFDPGSRYVPFGMLSWSEEGVTALIPDSKEPMWVTTPPSRPEKSQQKRTAKLRLLEDGTLEGDVQIEYTGHFGVEEKEYHDALAAAEQEEEITENIKERLSTAQVSGITLENVKDPVKPLVVRYHIKVPQYAQRTGRRLFFQPGFFEQGVPQTFSSASRKYPIYFHYPWSEVDDITIDLPQGFELENPEAPGNAKVGEVANLEIRIATTTDSRSLHYERKFSFGGQSILFPQTAYNSLKQVFDTFYKLDTFAMTLREASAQAK
jgi:Domain of Unknown Function with PDB structure (DUF3857)